MAATGTPLEILVVEEEARTAETAHRVVGKEIAAVRAGTQAGAGPEEAITGQDQGGITLMVIRKLRVMISAGEGVRLVVCECLAPVRSARQP